MNERIHEMILEFAEIAEEHSYGEYAKKQTGYSRQYFYNQKFAELIVRECVQTLIDNTPERYTNESAEEDWDKGYDRAIKDCVHHIKEHFGVE